MKYLFILLLLILFSFTSNAQILRFSDTLNNSLAITNSWASGSNITPSTTGYALTMKGVSPFLTIYYTDSLGNFNHSIDHKPFGTATYIDADYNTMIQLKNGRWLMPLLLRIDTIFSYEQAICIFDKNLTTPLFRKRSKFQNYSSYYLFAQPSHDSTSFWVSGRASISDYLKSTISHLDSNFNVISQQLIIPGLKASFAKSVLPTTNGKCLLSGIVSSTTNIGSELDQNFLAKVSDTGVEWYKEWGHPEGQDKGGFLFKGVTDTTYWLVTTENKHIDSLTDIIYKMRASLFTTSGIELLNKAIYRNLLAPYNQVGIQLSDNSIILGYLIYKYNQGFHGLITKYSPNMELLWESEIPVPNIPAAIGFYPHVNPLDIQPTADGGFICTGEYYNQDVGVLPWIGKMDADGCWDVGCSTVPIIEEASGKKETLKISPNPAKGYFTVECPLTEESLLQIYDLKGVLVYSTIINKANQGLTIQTTNWANGTYFYRYSQEGKTLQSGKIIVLK